MMLTHLRALGVPLQFDRHLRLFLHNPNLKLFNCKKRKICDRNTQPILLLFIQIVAKKDLQRRLQPILRVFIQITTKKRPFSFSSCSQPLGLLRLHLHCIYLPFPCIRLYILFYSILYHIYIIPLYIYLPFPCIRYQTGIMFNINMYICHSIWTDCS